VLNPIIIRCAQRLLFIGFLSALAVVLSPNIACAQAGTSAEAINPFNQFETSSGGINLFSGDVYMPQKIYTLPGRNGMNVDLELAYSSNVYLNVIARNDKAPTGWLGLGWQIKLGGNIFMDHNNTMTLEDDKYYYTSPEGVNHRLFEKDGIFYMEHEPYWKVERSLEGTNRIIGWTLTDPSGKVFKYGDFQNHGTFANRIHGNSTRYTLSWDGANNNNTHYVGEGSGGEPDQYAFQWDLNKIIDLSGNTITYNYDQQEEQIVTNDWTLTSTHPVLYTKASYLSQIINPEGSTISFVTQDKDPGEVWDPKTFSSEPDAFMEFYESKRLKKIQVKNPQGQLTREFEFSYGLINDDVEMLKIGSNYKKALLKKVYERAGVSTDLGRLEFAYDDDLAHRSRNGGVSVPDPNHNFGALTSVTGKLCGKVSFEYKKQNINFDKSPPIGSLSGFGDFIVKSGKIDNGNEYIVVANQYGVMWIYNWESGQWKPKDIYSEDGQTLLWKSGSLIVSSSCTPPPCNATMPPVQNFIATGDDYFVLLPQISTLDDGATFIRPFVWNGEKWVQSTIKKDNDLCPINGDCSIEQQQPPNGAYSVAIGKNYFVPFVYNPPDDGQYTTLFIYSYNWNGREWVRHMLRKSGYDNFQILGLELSGNNVLLKLRTDILPGNDDRAEVWNWNGSFWSSINTVSDEDRNNDYKIGDNYFARISESGLQYVGHTVGVWEWTGKELAQIMPESRLGGITNYSADFQVLGSGYFGARYKAHASLKLYQDYGTRWKSVFSEEFPNESTSGIAILDEGSGATPWHGYSGNDYFLATYPRGKYVTISCNPCGLWGGHCRIHYTQNVGWVKDDKTKAYNWSGGENNSWSQTDWGSSGEALVGKDPVAGYNFFVHKTAPHTSLVWNGTSWDEETRTASLTKDIDIVSDNVFTEKKDGNLFVHRKFQNSTTAPVFSYVVSKKTVEDPITGANHVFTYDYAIEASMYDTRNGTAKFNKVTVTVPNSGSEVSYFFNDYENQGFGKDNFLKSINADFEKLDGLPYKKEGFDVYGKKTSTQTFSYSVYRGGDRDWPTGIFYIRPTNNQSTIDGVTSSTDIVTNDGNGLPSQVTETNSDGGKRITATQYAFDVSTYSSDMNRRGANMLNQVATSTVYENTTEDVNARSAMAITWDPNIATGVGVRYPHQSFVWNDAGGSTGFKAFSYTAPSTNEANHWKLTQTSSNYDALGRLVEFQDAAGSAQSSYFGSHGLLQSASCQNAEINQCAVLTGDFDNNPLDQDGVPTGNYDIPSGWYKGGSTLSTAVSHYGTASIHVPGTTEDGPNKTIITAYRDYEFSAWVYPIQVTPASPVVLSVLVNGVALLPAGEAFGSLSPGATAGWQKIRRVIPGSYLGTAQVTVKVSSRGHSEFYVDDIRFNPKNSLVTTHYYDPKLMLPISDVAPGGQAEYRQYDEAGRITATFREDVARNKVKVSEIDYSNILGCSLGAPRTGRLAKASVENALINFASTTYDYANITVADAVEQSQIRFTPENPDEQVAVSIDGVATDCCKVEGRLDLPLGSGPKTVQIKVGSGTPYTFTISRLTSCWTYSGGSVSGTQKGAASALNFPGNQPYAAYRDEGDGLLYVKKYENNAWVTVGGPLSEGEATDINLKVYGGVPYVAFIDNRTITSGTAPNQTRKQVPTVVVKMMVTGGWSPVGGLGTSADGIVSKGASGHLSFDITQTPGTSDDGTLWVAYVGDPVSEDNFPTNQSVSERVYARKLSGQVWVPVGDLVPTPTTPSTPTTGDGIQDGIISEFSAKSVSLAVGPDGKPYVAFAGKQAIIVDDGVNPPSIQLSGITVIVKKLRTIGGVPTWSSMEDEIANNSSPRLGGDIIDAANPNSVSLAFSGSNLFIAYDYQYLKTGTSGDLETSEERVLTVREFLPTHVVINDSHWIPIPDVTTESDTRILVVDSKADYHFTVQNNIPEIVFSNEHSGYRITVIKFDAASQKWKSIGIPGFSQGKETSQERNVSIGLASDGTQYVSFQSGLEPGSNRNGKISVSKYNTQCKDPTLLGISLKKPDHSEVALELGFKQYYTYYTGTVEDGVNTLTIDATPNSCADIGAISLRSNDVTLDSWINTNTNGGCSTLKTFSLPLNEGVNYFEVWGLDKELKNTIQYRYTIFKKANPVPNSFTLENGSGLKITPDFSVSNPGPYVFEDVNYTQTSIILTPTFSPNTKVWINDKPIGSGQQVRIDLQVGVNVITVSVQVSDGTIQVYTYSITRLPQGGTSTSINQVVLFKLPVADITLVPNSKTVTQHEIYVTGDISSIRVVEAAANACPTFVNQVEITGGEILVPLPGDATTLDIVKKCPDQKPEEHFVTVIKSGKPLSQSIVGHREGNEPQGFYEFSDLERAEVGKAAVIASLPQDGVPASVLLYVVSDQGTDLVSSPPVEIIPFTNGATQVPLIIKGIQKGSSQYLDLLNQFLGQAVVP
jgi:hypothetical protein